MEPIRTCVGCRQRASRSDLLRVVAASQKLVIDERGGLAGRGAWLHASKTCLNLAIERRAFGRALRAEGPFDVSALTQPIEQAETMLATK
jgi:predicted RNA-binding protein YlxR (DUF448 family)